MTDVARQPIIFQQAVELGAQTSSSLTDIVTHLICIGPGQCEVFGALAVQFPISSFPRLPVLVSIVPAMGVPIMHPSWIIEAHQNWLKGEAVTHKLYVLSNNAFSAALKKNKQSMEAHRLPIFATASLSLSGIPDLDMRTQMQKLTKTNGGKFVKDIGPGSKVTHLVCGRGPW